MARAPGPPAYRQVADSLRADIHAGRYQPGDLLPSEHQLQDQHQVSQKTVRAAIDLLRSEGRIITWHGRGSYVRVQPVPRRLTVDLAAGPRRGWNATLDRAGLVPEVRTSVAHRPASRQVADYLGVAEGETVLVRDRIMGVRGEPPTQLAASHIPLDVVARAPTLGQPDTGPGGMLTRLEDAGYTLHFDEIVSTRMPDPDEARWLELLQGTPVLVVWRLTYDADDRVLDAQRRVVAGDRCELAYRFAT